MITFILLGFFFVLAIAFGIVAYSANSRKRAGMSGVDPAKHRVATETRAPGSHN